MQRCALVSSTAAIDMNSGGAAHVRKRQIRVCVCKEGVAVYSLDLILSQ